MADTVEVRPDAAQFAELYREIRAFDQKLASALRRRIRDTAGGAVAEVRERLQGGSFKQDVGLRRGLAAGTKVSIRTGVRSAGVSITTTGAKLPPGKRAMVYAFDKPTFRRPVFARSGRERVFVEQHGRPYFGAVLGERSAQWTTAVEAAITDAAASITAGELT